MSDPTLMLWSSGLLSKWGFGDGDMPDHLMDHIGDDAWADIDWHGALRLLVRRHLLPALTQQVEVYDVETIHNPIRAARVDGVEIDDYADNDHIALTPEYVEVSWGEIQAAIKEAGGSSSRNEDPE